MRRLLTGCFVTLLLLLNTLVLFGPLMVFALLKLILPGRFRDVASWAVMWIAETWAEVDKLIFRLCIPTQWDIRGGDELRRDTSYLVISNHQSWVDIPALIQTLNRRTPFFKFFLKKELIWVPFLGLAWWALDYPFMKRYTKAFLAKNPELAGKDLEITKQACELYKRQPVTVVNYLEGTRFTAAKRVEQQSPFTHLLKPKAGGVAFVLAAMGEQLDAILDVTVVYPQQKIPGFWDLLSGNVPRIIIDIKTRELDPALWQGDYENDPAFRETIQNWSTSSGSRRTSASTPCAPSAAESTAGAGAPDSAQAFQQRTADALLTEVLQNHRGKLADHAAVHAQCAEGAVQVIGVLNVAQGVFQTCRFTGRTEQAAESAQFTATRQFVDPRYAFGQLRVIRRTQLIFRQTEHRPGAANGLLRGHVQLAERT